MQEAQLGRARSSGPPPTRAEGRTAVRSEAVIAPHVVRASAAMTPARGGRTISAGRLCGQPRVSCLRRHGARECGHTTFTACGASIALPVIHGFSLRSPRGN